MKNFFEKVKLFFSKDLKYAMVNLKNNIANLFKGKRNQIFIATGILVVILVIIAITCSINGEKTENISRDLANMGFVTKNGNHIYYLGYDTGSIDGIYKMKLNATKIEKVNGDYALYLNSDGKNIYYLDYENEDLVKVKNNGKDKEILTETLDFATVTLDKDYIYYMKNSNLYKIKTNGKNNEKILSKDIHSYEINDGWIYYTYYNDGAYTLAKIKTSGKDKTILSKDAGVNFFIKNENIYYIYKDESNESGVNEYRLCKMKTDGSNQEILTTIENLDAETLNTDGNKIYYARTDSDGMYSIYSMKLNGKDENKIVDINGYKTSINILDGYIYYQDKNESEDSTLYRIKTKGGEKQEII